MYPIVVKFDLYFQFQLQFCTHHETSHKKHFPTFARTRPPDIQISKSVVSLLLVYNWTQVTFFYLDADDLPLYGAVAETIMLTMKQFGISVRAVHTWQQVYHYGYMKNPFEELVERTMKDTRSKWKTMFIISVFFTSQFHSEWW